MPSDGGPAFPLPFIFDESRGHAGQYIDGEDAGVCTGLTIRDWFAGQALGGLIADASASWQGKNDAEIQATVARYAYGLADAMLEARQPEP